MNKVTEEIIAGLHQLTVRGKSLHNDEKLYNDIVCMIIRECQQGGLRKVDCHIITLAGRLSLLGHHKEEIISWALDALETIITFLAVHASKNNGELPPYSRVEVDADIPESDCLALILDKSNVRSEKFFGVISYAFNAYKEVHGRDKALEWIEGVSRFLHEWDEKVCEAKKLLLVARRYVIRPSVTAVVVKSDSNLVRMMAEQEGRGEIQILITVRSTGHTHIFVIAHPSEHEVLSLRGLYRKLRAEEPHKWWLPSGGRSILNKGVLNPSPTEIPTKDLVSMLQRHLGIERPIRGKYSGGHLVC
ncbi:MAG: hypothetical protein WDZ88_04320 [Candidatus Paceibacterota bacterium]